MDGPGYTRQFLLQVQTLEVKVKTERHADRKETEPQSIKRQIYRKRHTEKDGENEKQIGAGQWLSFCSS